ncbi:MAG: CoA-acylating methylmalonate-semialdehyde dehydrogenase [Candidatus Eisenbacteria bacterium]|uniref:methylmalonate-semialdehyde dehydrogenase (CoA acylating) n=1 Tax=Eiseniibacteriota bacterium TaxID=2212470 RepID=A0A948W6P8_UNCEI|nr:CoA-acylating methylmalonate-semialdehyde dehydrogenase [Candidatus Eisenbacteria bacterium]MBU1951226.1 CoA-acylating methylmalonate-semialdehyde dehydrogenase [Candidatus Eisenbacteria bacterium]MBU2691345.1 CoA-acylating methylmalonate-semialdehyde dehydrogenase [Candidatus Eisenbacteria bacterium]
MSENRALPALLPNYIGGKRKASRSKRHLPVTNPTTGEVITQVPMSLAADLEDAVQCAAEAQSDWGETPVKDRVQYLFRMKTLMEKQKERLAKRITEENGKTHEESLGSILRAVECLEFAASLPQLIPGGGLEVGRGVECRTIRYPIGITACITPFNFPLMVPLWMSPLALACGNAVILKPSEQTPLSAMELADLFSEAGLPPGVFSVVHGDKEIVEAICDHPGIAAIGFVGSTPVAKAVHLRGTRHGKRVRALGGAKNHLIVVPDADHEMTATNVVASVTGCAGQRCMAAAVLLAVGAVDPIINRIREKMAGIVAGGNMGPMISQAAKERVSGYINRAEDGEAILLLDGRDFIAESAPSGGYFIGPSIIDHASPEHEASRDEIFGPVLTIIRCKTLDEALAVENSSPYGNAAAVYTSSGKVAQYFVEHADSGMLGINIGVPVPREPFAFGGWNDSRFGEGDLTGFGAIDFWTKSKKITTKWSAQSKSNWMS